MSATTMGVKLDSAMRERLKVLGDAKQRSPHWLMREAIREYVEREEQYLQRNQETLERWERYQLADEYVEHDEVATWLDSWGSDEEGECPAPHD